MRIALCKLCTNDIIINIMKHKNLATAKFIAIENLFDFQKGIKNILFRKKPVQ